MQKSHRLDVLCYVDNEQDVLDNAGAVPSCVSQWHRVGLGAQSDLFWDGVVVRSDEIVIKVSEDQLSVAALVVVEVTDYSKVILEKDVPKTFDGSREHIIQQVYDLFLHAWQPSKLQQGLKFWDIFIWTLCGGNYCSASWIKRDFLAWCKAT